MGGAAAGDAGDASPAILSTYNIRPLDVAWKESTSNGPRPFNRRAVATLLLKCKTMLRTYPLSENYG